jgi:hypothetical protein
MLAQALRFAGEKVSYREISQDEAACGGLQGPRGKEDTLKGV